MNPSARDKIRALLDDGEDDAARQDSAAHDARQHGGQERCIATVEMLKSFGLDGDVIEHLERSCRVGCEQSKWSRLTRAIHFVDVDVACRKAKMRLMRVAAGTQIPAHSHRGEEITLVLKGAMEDEYGTYGPGDLIVLQHGEMHAPHIGGEEELVCLTLTYKPVLMKCMVKRAFNLFFRF